MTTPIRGFIVAAMAVTLAGCGSEDAFWGRVIVLNSTGGPIRSIDAGYSNDKTYNCSWKKISPGEAGSYDCGDSNPIPIRDAFRVSYVDDAGAPIAWPVAFKAQAPADSRDDFMIEILRDRPPRSGLLTAWTPYDESGFAAAAIGFAAILGAVLGWSLRHLTMQPARPAKPANDREL